MTGKVLRVALTGNPNCGKTTIFNLLTGARHHVANYPGVTVERKDGRRRHGDYELRITDLPGAYSLTAYSLEELVARNFLIDERPDVVVNVVDASNLERNLYLTVQLMELGLPLVLVFNMSDIAKRRGIEFDLDQLSRYFGAPIVPAVGSKNIGGDAILSAIVEVGAGRFPHKPSPIHYGREIDAEIDALERILVAQESAPQGLEPRWVALKMLEQDEAVMKAVQSPEAEAEAARGADRLQSILGDHPEILIADRRYGFISGACQESVRATVEMRHSMSDKIDAVVTHRALAVPLFLILMYLTFHLTFTLGAPLMDMIEAFFGWAGSNLATLWPKDSDSALRSLILDGVIAGVGGVIVFLPNILLLFLAIAIIEDTGYMARAAFIMDRIMHKIGLHGKSFIPMLIGFGCSVPAIMATRTLESRRDRLTTILITPLMSCGARLPIYALIIPAFFPSRWQAPMLWTIYLIGILLAVALAKLLRVTVFRGETEPFVMELPPYRLPTLKGAAIHMWERGWLYLRKAGTLILSVSIVLWALTSYPVKTELNADYDALTEQAWADHLDQARRLNPALGLAPDADLLIRALEAERQVELAAERFHPHEADFQAAVEAADHQTQQLAGSPDGGEALRRFLIVRDQILEARQQFETIVHDEELDARTPEWAAMDLRLRHRMQELESREPLADVARDYLEGPWETYRETLDRLRARRQSELLEYTLAGRVGHAMRPLLAPMGFDWRIGTALIGAFAAKEVFVSQISIVLSVGETETSFDSLRGELRRRYTPLIGFCIMLFCLIATPCMATIAVTWRETNSWQWALAQLGGLTVLAWVITTLVYQIGSLLGIGV